MARYYTLCETTPGEAYGKNQYLRVFTPASEGILFHDTDAPLKFVDIQKALWMISDIYENAQKVIAIRVDKNTIMTTFSTASIPKPSRQGQRYSTQKQPEYLETHKIRGWLLRDIKDPACEPVAVDFNDLYNDCTMLERFTDCCPCPKKNEGTCLPSTVYLRYPWLAENITNYSGTEPERLKTKRFKEIDGFEYVSGQLATSADFTEAVRPWDNYDFSLVVKRKAKFAERGQNTAHRFAHRKAECTQCVFSTKKYTGSYVDCGRISECVSHSTEEQAWAVLFDWLDNNTSFTKGRKEFSLREINYLIHEAGLEAKSRAITETRNIDTILGGFHFRYEDGPLMYRVAAGRGNLARHKYFDSYEELRRHYPMLPASEDLPSFTVSRKMLLAHAIFARWNNIPGTSGSWGHSQHPVWRIAQRSETMSIYGHTTKSSFEGACLSAASSVHQYVTALWRGGYADISRKYLRLASR